jgi:hypothetical protein
MQTVPQEPDNFVPSMTNDHMTLAEGEVENSVAVAFFRRLVDSTSKSCR